MVMCDALVFQNSEKFVAVPDLELFQLRLDELFPTTCKHQERSPRLIRHLEYMNII